MSYKDMRRGFNEGGLSSDKWPAEDVGSVIYESLDPSNLWSRGFSVPSDLVVYLRPVEDAEEGDPSAIAPV